jgi:hypothetical protein
MSEARDTAPQPSRLQPPNATGSHSPPSRVQLRVLSVSCHGPPPCLLARSCTAVASHFFTLLFEEQGDPRGGKLLECGGKDARGRRRHRSERSGWATRKSALREAVRPVEAEGSLRVKGSGKSGVALRFPPHSRSSPACADECRFLCPRSVVPQQGTGNLHISTLTPPYLPSKG